MHLPRHVLLICLLPLAGLGFAAEPAADQTPQAIAPPDALTLQGMPPIPGSVEEAVGPYTELRSAAFQDWHPRRHEMLVATRFANATQIHLVDHPGGARRQMTFFEEPVGWASWEPTEGRYFCLLKDQGGDEYFQIFRFDTQTGRAVLLTDGDSRHRPGPWSNAGDRLTYQRQPRTEDVVTEIHTIDPARPETDRCVATLEGGGWGVSDWSPDDKTLLVLEYISVNESRVWAVDVESGDKRRLTPDHEEKVSHGRSKFAADGKTILVVTDFGGEFRRIARYDPETKEYDFLTPEIGWDVTSFDLTRDRRRAVYETNEDGIDRLHHLDLETGKTGAFQGVPDGVLSGATWHPDGSIIAFTANNAHSPSDAYTIDPKAFGLPAEDAVQRWTWSETGGLDAANFAEPELIHWTSFDDLRISGFLYRPDPQHYPGPRPVVMIIHGGPEAQSRPLFQGRYNYCLDQLGVALLYPNVRGSTGYGKTFSQLDNGFLRENTYRDIDALFRWIAKDEGLDADRIMVTGGSYGGHMTLAVATRYSDRIACSVSIVGISNLRTFLENTKPYRRDLRRVEYGDERDPEMRAFLDRIAPMAHVDKIDKPIFIIQGRNDPRVPISEADQIVETVRDNNVPVWYLVAENEGHGFRKKENSDYQFYATMHFVERFLLDN